MSVLSVIEGLEITNFSVKTWQKSIEIIVLTILFFVQKNGTQIVENYFPQSC